MTGIAVRRPELHLDHAPANLLTRDCWDVIDDVDVVVELIGGSDPAGDLVQAALAAGKPVVTANKLLLAADARLESFDDLRYSAAVGGAVPALEAVRALAADGQIVSFSGVLNGTCNYILDRIAAGCSWEQAVAEAQAKGFAEQDPRADVSGSDTVCKLRLLARRAFPEAEALLGDDYGALSPSTRMGASRRPQRQSSPAGRHALAWPTARSISKSNLQLVDAGHPVRANQERRKLPADRCRAAGRFAATVWTGRGAGRWPTTAAVMADLFDLSRESAKPLKPPSAIFA